MPGPGGGSRGGGFGGRGSGGGGFGGSRGGFSGGFGGGYRPRPYFRPYFRPHFGGGWHRGPYMGGGCLGGLVNMIMLPVILLIIVLTIAFAYIGSTLSAVMDGGRIEYDEREFQNYANIRYSEEFGASSAYEDNLLIVFLTDEKYEEFYCIAFIGDNVNGKINNMFGDETTEFGRAVMSSVNRETYEFSLSSNLASAVDIMTSEVGGLGLKSSFRSDSDHSSMTEPHLTNYTELGISEKTVEASLKNFTAATDIPVVIVVDTMENVFGKSFGFADVVVILFLGSAVILLVFWITKASMAKKNQNTRGPKSDAERNDGL